MTFLVVTATVLYVLGMALVFGGTAALSFAAVVLILVIHGERARRFAQPAPTSAGSARYPARMCRSIKTLRRADAPATDEEVRAAALQFVRKVSGYRVPSRRNTEAFDAAVDDVAEASRRLLDALGAAR